MGLSSELPVSLLRPPDRCGVEPETCGRPAPHIPLGGNPAHSSLPLPFHADSEFILGPALQAYGGAGAASDSEVEDEASHVILPDRFRGRGNLKSQKSAIRLAELGPRLRLRLMKVQRGFMEGDVIYHDYIKKTPEEVRALEAKAKAERELKKRRREEQEGNVARKELKLKEAQERKIERQAARAAKREAEDRGEGPDEQGGLAEG